MLIINSQQYLHPDLDELLGFLLCFVFLSVIQKMEESVTAHGRNSNKGLWNCPRFKYSKDTQELMQGVFVWPGLSFDFFLLIDYLIDWLISTVMMQESRLTNFQQRQINKQLKSKLYMFFKSPHQFHLDYCSPLLITGRVWGTHTDLCTNQKPSSVGVTMFNVTKFYTTTLLRSQFSMIWVEAVTVDSSAGCNSSHRFVLMRSFWYVIVIII